MLNINKIEHDILNLINFGYARKTYFQMAVFTRSLYKFTNKLFFFCFLSTMLFLTEVHPCISWQYLGVFCFRSDLHHCCRYSQVCHHRSAPLVHSRCHPDIGTLAASMLPINQTTTINMHKHCNSIHPINSGQPKK